MTAPNVISGTHVKKQVMSRTEDKKFLGVHIEADLDEYLSLWVIVHYSRKTKIIRTLLDEWRKKQTQTEDVLIDEILSRIKIEWLAEKPALLESLKGKEDKLEVAFELFKSEMKRNLDKKGLSRRVITKILNRLEI